jgi:hypothetical protein
MFNLSHEYVPRPIKTPVKNVVANRFFSDFEILIYVAYYGGWQKEPAFIVLNDLPLRADKCLRTLFLRWHFHGKLPRKLRPLYNRASGVDDQLVLIPSAVLPHPEPDPLAAAVLGDEL